MTNSLEQQENPHNKPSRLAANLIHLLKTHYLNATDLAQKLGIPMVTIRRLMLGHTTDPRISTLQLIADHFQTSVDALMQKNLQAELSSTPTTRPCLVPLLDWETAEKINTLSDLNLQTWPHWQPVSWDEPEPLSPLTFALESRRSMYTRFPQGTVFIVSPDVTPVDGDMVLMRLKTDHKLTLRELRIDAPEWQLYSILPDGKVLEYSSTELAFAGVVLLTLFYNRREMP